jgi:antitoxin (DNA-binding transcriptional repressor) of toxin-antitoxin stability system
MQVSIRELKNRLSHYLARTQDGEEVTVTLHKRVIAHIRGVPRTNETALRQLIESGNVEWAGGKPKGAHIRLEASEKTLADLVIEDRG